MEEQDVIARSELAQCGNRIDHGKKIQTFTGLWHTACRSRRRPASQPTALEARPAQSGGAWLADRIVTAGQVGQTRRPTRERQLRPRKKDPQAPHPLRLHAAQHFAGKSSHWYYVRVRRCRVNRSNNSVARRHTPTSSGQSGRSGHLCRMLVISASWNEHGELVATSLTTCRSCMATVCGMHCIPA